MLIHRTVDMGLPPRSWLFLLAGALATAGCLSTPLGPGDPLETRGDPWSPDRHGLVVDVVTADDALLEPEVLRVEAASVPEAALNHQVGPEPVGEEGTGVVGVSAYEGAVLDRFKLRLVVDDGLGPALLELEVGPWMVDGEAFVTVELGMPSVGSVAVGDIEGDVDVEPVRDPSLPQYGYLAYEKGAREPLTSFPHVVVLPEGFPRMAAGAEPTFELEDDAASVEWLVNGQRAGAGADVKVDPGPGRHTLSIVDVASGERVELVFSIHDRFVAQDAIKAGTLDHRESLAGVNEESYPVSIHEGAFMMRAILEPLGKEKPREDLDLYALNETGTIIGQSVSENSTREHLTVPTSALSPGEEVRIKVHGHTAVDTEYSLSVTTFYRPW